MTWYRLAFVVKLFRDHPSKNMSVNFVDLQLQLTCCFMFFFSTANYYHEDEVPSSGSKPPQTPKHNAPMPLNRSKRRVDTEATVTFEKCSGRERTKLKGKRWKLLKHPLYRLLWSWCHLNLGIWQRRMEAKSKKIKFSSTWPMVYLEWKNGSWKLNLLTSTSSLHQWLFTECVLLYSHELTTRAHEGCHSTMRPSHATVFLQLRACGDWPWLEAIAEGSPQIAPFFSVFGFPLLFLLPKLEQPNSRGWNSEKHGTLFEIWQRGAKFQWFSNVLDNLKEIEKDSKNKDSDRRKPHAEPVFQVPSIKGSEPLPLGVRPQKEIWCRSFGQKSVIHTPYFRLKTYENCKF